MPEVRASTNVSTRAVKGAVISISDLNRQVSFRLLALLWGVSSGRLIFFKQRSEGSAAGGISRRQPLATGRTLNEDPYISSLV